jgi:hypothetical protein
MRKKRGRDTKGHRSKSKATLSSGRPSGFVDLPESYTDALAGVTGTFKFSANFIALGSFREGFPTNNT